ncbi:MAG: hypothetical protein WA624_05395 [Methylocella sp.]
MSPMTPEQKEEISRSLLPTGQDKMHSPENSDLRLGSFRSTWFEQLRIHPKMIPSFRKSYRSSVPRCVMPVFHIHKPQ